MLLGVVVLASVCFLGYMGVFNGIEVKEEALGPYTYAYEPFVGDYKNTGPLFKKIRQSLLDDGVVTSRAVGIYYDDPSKVPADKLRSDAGCVIEEKDFSKLPKLLEKYTIKTLPAGKRVCAEFPIKNGLSYSIGAMKAYPALMKYVSEKGLRITRVFELYDMPAGKTLYVLEAE
jgi:hypothetical protein